MQTFLAIEIEVEFRRREYEREVAAEARAAQVRPENERMRWSHLRSLVVARLRSLASPRLPVTPWGAAAVQHAQPLQGGRATVT